MAYNTAVSFVLVGLALGSLAFGRRSWAIGAAAPAGLIALGRLFQYTTGWFDHFETILSRFTLPHPPMAQRMAPNTACAFLLIAAAIGLIGMRREFRWKAVTVALTGSAAAALGLDSFIGYLIGLPTYLWGGFTPMALHTSAGFIVAGAGVMAFFWRENPTARKDWRSSALVIVATLGIVASLSFWSTLSLEEHLYLDPSLQSGLPGTVLVFGLLVTVLVGTAVFLAQTARLRTGISEHMRLRAECAVQSLANSERKYRTLLESLPQKIAYKDRECVYVSCNDNYAQDLGMPAAAIAGKTDYDFYPRELAEKYRADDRRVMEIGEAAEIEEEYLRQGEKQWVQTVKAPVRDEQGNVGGVIVIFWDITERRKADLELAAATKTVEEERRRFNEVLDRLPAYVVLLSPDYHVPFANRYFRERFGESQGRRCFEYLFGRSEPCEICETYRVLRTKAPHRWEWRGPDQRDYDIYDFPFTEADGSTLILEMGIDITERKHAEIRIQEQAALLNLAHDAIVVRDMDARVLFWNPGAAETYGWSAEEAKNQPIHELLHSRFPQPLEEIEALVREHGKWEGELRHTTRDGRILVVASRWSLQSDEGGRPRGILEINRDITDRKKAEDALEQKAQDLARSNADLEQFAYVASHDLQEPLRMVANFTQLLADRYRDRLGQEGAEFITYAVDGATRMQRLIQDLLTYSRVGTRGKSFEPTDCNEVLGLAVANLQLAIQEAHAVVTHDELPPVLADASQLAQLFQNLVGNAVKFRGPEAPRVHVSAARQGTDWVFSVRDNGIGIDAAFAERIFIIFQRLHARGEYPGTGIGLSLCKKIVERHGGKIWVESESGKGATFLFTIPASS